MFIALTTTLTLDDAYDLTEIEDVRRSWRDAENASREADSEERERARGKGRK